MRIRTFAAAAGAAALLLVGTVPATALENPIDIRVEMDLPTSTRTKGPAVFLVQGVTPGAGPELTGADLVANPSNWLGDVNVDVDPAARTITVNSPDDMDFGSVSVRITSQEFRDVVLVSDTYGKGADAEFALSYTTDATGATFTWLSDTPGEYPYTTGSAVFSYTERTFADVPGSHPFIEQIEWLAAEGLTTGTEVGGELYFYPAAPMSRQAMAAFLFRYLGDPEFAAPATASFSDVPTTHPFFREIEWLTSEGIAQGYDDGTYGPGKSVSRQAMAAFLHRSVGAPDVHEAPTFTDVPADHPFATAIAWLEMSGVAGGYADGTFGPGRTISRQAMASFLHKLDQIPL